MGKMAKKGLYYNINQKKKAGTSNTKAKSTISDESLCKHESWISKKKK